MRIIKYRVMFFIYITIFLTILNCGSSNQLITDKTPVVPIIDQPAAEETKTQRAYNFKFTALDVNIDDPEMDRRSYYRVFIDKVDAGRTTIGLESQMKSYESILPQNRHLMIVEKWVLDEKKGKYVKLNNIEQPKPDYIYFDVTEDKTVVITLRNDPVKNKSSFQVEFE